MSESKTPRTDTYENHLMRNVGGHSFTGLCCLCRKLETELAEANRKLAQSEEMANHFNGKANDFYAELLKARNQLAFIQDQIQSGELVPLHVIQEWLEESWRHGLSVASLKKLASERARKAGGE